MKKLLFIFLILFVGFAFSAATNFVGDPSSCPATDATEFPGQNCAPVEICGESSDIAQCFDTSTISAPGVDLNSTTNWDGGFDGGYLTDCFATADASAPFCDNSGAFWCDRNSTCQSVNRVTQCNANVFASGANASECVGCRSGFTFCDADPSACEVQIGVTACSGGANNNLNSSCACTCDTGFLDCDASGPGAGSGCEVESGVTACQVGDLNGVFDGCTCVIPKQNFETGTKAFYNAGDENAFIGGNNTGDANLMLFCNNLANPFQCVLADTNANMFIDGNMTALSFNGNGFGLTNILASNVNILDSDNFWGVTEVESVLQNVGRFRQFFNGTFLEPFDARTTSDGNTVTMSLERVGGGDLTMVFNNGYTTLDCTPACTIALTAGSDTSPQTNYVYIPESTENLTKSTTSFPTTAEYIPVGFFFVSSASHVQSDGGTLINQNWNNFADNDVNVGHDVHIGDRLRRGKGYFSGIDPNGIDQDTVSSYFDFVGGDEVYWKSTAGTAYQLHLHSISAIDTNVTNEIHVVNWNGEAYHTINEISDIVNDATGSSLANKYFNVFFFVAVNKSAEHSPLLAQVASGSYSSQVSAENDVDGFNNETMPREFGLDSSVGVPIARLTMRWQGGTTTLSHISTTDLRQGGGAGGSGAAGSTMFADNQFDIFNVDDDTKVIDFNAAAITTSNTRTITMADFDVDLGWLNQDVTSGSSPVFVGTNFTNIPVGAIPDFNSSVDILFDLFAWDSDFNSNFDNQVQTSTYTIQNSWDFTNGLTIADGFGNGGISLIGGTGFFQNIVVANDTNVVNVSDFNALGDIICFADNFCTLGSPILRWSNLYAHDGNFADDLLVQDDVTIGGNTNVSVTTSINVPLQVEVSTAETAAVARVLSLVAHSTGAIAGGLGPEIEFAILTDADAYRANAFISAPRGSGSNNRQDLVLSADDDTGDKTDYLRLSSTAPSELIVNDGGVDIDFRVETTGQASAFILDAGADTATFNVPLTINSTLGSGAITSTGTIEGTAMTVDNGTSNAILTLTGNGSAFQGIQFVGEGSTIDRDRMGIFGVSDSLNNPEFKMYVASNTPIGAGVDAAAQTWFAFRRAGGTTNIFEMMGGEEVIAHDYVMRNASATEKQYARVKVSETDDTAGNEDATYAIETITAGSLVTSATFTGSNMALAGDLEVNGDGSFGIAGTEGTLHVHTASAGSVTANTIADDLVVENDDRAGITILSPDADDSGLFFGSPVDNIAAGLRWDPTTLKFLMGVANASADLSLVVGNFNIEALNIDTVGKATFIDDVNVLGDEISFGSNAFVNTLSANTGSFFLTTKVPGKSFFMQAANPGGQVSNLLGNISPTDTANTVNRGFQALTTVQNRTIGGLVANWSDNTDATRTGRIRITNTLNAGSVTPISITGTNTTFNGNVQINNGILGLDKGGAGFGQLKLDGGSGGCLMIRDDDDAGWSKGTLLNGVITWAIDADGVC